MAKYRKHNFDLNNPTIVKPCEELAITYNVYTCKKCGKTLGLNKSQMESLPLSMAYGCTGGSNA